MADEFQDEEVRAFAAKRDLLRGKRESLMMSVTEIDKVLGSAKAFSGFNAESLVDLYRKYKPALVKAGFAAGGGGLFSFLPSIKSFLGGLLG